MAIRNLVLNLGSGSDVQAVSGHILINRHTAGSTDAGLWIFDSPERVVLTNPARTVPLEVGVAYKFAPVIPSGTTIYAYMTAGAGDLNYLDLVSLDPATLTPIANPEAAWWATADANVIDGAVVGDDLILTHYDATTTNAGRVTGALSDPDIAALVPGPSATQAALDSTYGTLANRKMNLRDMVTPSGTDDTAAVNSALATFAAAGGGTLQIPRDNWKFTGSIGLALTGTSVPIHIEADAGTVFDMTGSTAGCGILLGGSATYTSAALGADAAKWADTITCALAVTAGDILRILSTDPWEPLVPTPKGELVEVLSSASGVITLKAGLWDSYAASTTTVTLMQMPRVSVEGLEIVRNSNHQGLMVTYARDVLLGGLVGSGARERIHGLNYVYGGTVDNCSGTDFWYSGTGTSYGLEIASSQHITERGNIYRGGRHAVSHGGTFPCRDIQVLGGTFDNYHPSVQASFDFHPNVESVRMVGATILNGLGSAASDLDMSACTLRGQNRSAAEMYISRSCDYVRIRGCDVQSSPGQHGLSWLERGSSAAHTVGLVEFDGLIRAGGIGVQMLPVTSSDANLIINRLIISGDIESGGTSAAVNIGNQGVATYQINEAELSGRFYAPAYHCMVVAAGVPIGVMRLRGKFSSGTANAFRGLATTGDVYADDFTLQGASSSVFSNTGTLGLRNGLIDGASTLGGISAAAPSEALVSNVRRINTTGTPTLPARTYHTITASGAVIGTGTVAPVAGTWAVGDEIKHKTPAVGSPKGWVCTVAGTPGTWVSIGNL